MTFFPDTRLYSLDCSCLSHCSFEDGRFEIKKRPLLSMFFCFFYQIAVLYVDLMSHHACRFKLPAAALRSPGQHATDVTGVQSAGIGPQSAGQRVRQLPAARHLKRHGYKAEPTGTTAIFTAVLVFLKTLY